MRGLSCNLQHLQAIISKDIAERWNVSESWSLRASSGSGSRPGPPRGGVDKQFAPLEPRAKVYGKKAYF